MELAVNVASVAAGGALGAVARYLINLSPINHVFERFPLPTFVINVLGSFFIGLLLILLTDKYQPSEAFRLAIMVGFLGAFTTFSTFEIEIYGLIKEGATVTAMLYLIASVAVGFLGLVAGISIGRQMV